jgi:hypothetical protein
MDEFTIKNIQGLKQKIRELTWTKMIFKPEKLECSIKTSMRSTISQQRLNWLTLLSIEKGILTNIDYNGLIKEFASQKALKMRF